MDRRYSVYVIQIKSRCKTCKARRKPGMRCCVGSTAKTPGERFAQRLDPPPGHKRTIVTKCGWKLPPDLAPVRTYVSREAAEAAERLLATRLRQQGYTVFGPR